MLQEITFRSMTEGDLPGAYVLSQQVRWAHRLDDWRQAWQCGGGVVAQLADKVVGTALCWRWGPSYATLGLVIVDRVCQGQGIGKRLMSTLLTQLAGYNVRLNATPAGRALYLQLGFHDMGVTHQHQSHARAAITALTLPAAVNIRSANTQDIDRLLLLDSMANGVQRPALLQTLLHDGANLLLLERDGQVSGFAALRRFGHGYTIGPVVADNVAGAQLLINRLLLPLSDQFVRIDVDAASELSDWLIACGVPLVDAPVAMIRGTHFTPQAAAPRGFALASQAMG